MSAISAPGNRFVSLPGSTPSATPGAEAPSDPAAVEAHIEAAKASGLVGTSGCPFLKGEINADGTPTGKAAEPVDPLSLVPNPEPLAGQLEPPTGHPKASEVPTPKPDIKFLDRFLDTAVGGFTNVRDFFRGSSNNTPWTDWDEKPTPVALAQLLVMREKLYGGNLYDTYLPGDRAGHVPGDLEKPATAETTRQIDGKWNDLENPGMGAANVRFGRNVPIAATWRDDENLLTPNPREISRTLLTRDEFKPVPFLNLLAASWIQFMTHDWFSHGAPKRKAEMIDVPLAKDDPFRTQYGMQSLEVPRTDADPSRTPEESGLPDTYLNKNTHWWDGSQIYGSDLATANSLRSFKDGKLKLDGDGLLPKDAQGLEETGFKDNWWVGLSMLHTLFAKEHNAICDMLKKSHPEFSDQELYDHARLINAAEMAKIHTVEWTPAILPNPVLKIGMDANWYGLLQPNHDHAIGTPNIDDPLFGLVGNSRNLDKVPFSLTEEFVSVYRLHSLLPESIAVKHAKDGKTVGAVATGETRNEKSAQLGKQVGMSDLFYSFGTEHPGALTLNNFPKFLQDLDLEGFEHYDVAAVDILRDRERGVPRYNQFRRLMQLKPITRFEDLTDDKAAVEKLKRIYGNDVEKVDLLVGCLAEGHRPEFFGFGETAFQVFILMASRRLRADRFFTTDYRPEVYTKEGLERIDKTTMKGLILEHFPQLAPKLEGVDNAFNPWKD